MMKKISYLTFIFLFFSIGIFAQNNEIIEVETFNTLTIKGSFNVILHTGESYLRLENDANNDVKVENKDGVLSITSESGKEVLYNVYIGSPGLQNVNIDIDGNFTAQKNAISFSTINFNGKIKGETKLNLKGEVFVGNFNDCGKITMKGTIDKLYLNLVDSKNINTKFLTAKAKFVNSEY